MSDDMLAIDMVDLVERKLALLIDEVCEELNLDIEGRHWVIAELIWQTSQKYREKL